ncbi:hypothetical protein [Rhizobium leguminosarum]|uniref:hypothetical protein n=1 Tax=Rhizobium leguminosarum TaxID=384 RepID=UPI003D6DFC9E
MGQETIADILKSMEMGGKAEGTLKPPSNEDVEKMLDAEGVSRRVEERFRPGVRRRYLTAQLDGHNKLLTIQEDYLKVSQDRVHLSVTKLARGQIKEHIDHLDTLKPKAG